MRFDSAVRTHSVNRRPSSEEVKTSRDTRSLDDLLPGLIGAVIGGNARNQLTKMTSNDSIEWRLYRNMLVTRLLRRSAHPLGA